MENLLDGDYGDLNGTRFERTYESVKKRTIVKFYDLAGCSNLPFETLFSQRYMDEVISRCVQPKKEDTATATSATCPRQQVCDNVVKVNRTCRHLNPDIL